MFIHAVTLSLSLPFQESQNFARRMCGLPLTPKRIPVVVVVPFELYAMPGYPYTRLYDIFFDVDGGDSSVKLIILKIIGNLFFSSMDARFKISITIYFSNAKSAFQDQYYNNFRFFCYR